MSYERLADIFADLESQMLVNQKAIFEKFPRYGVNVEAWKSQVIGYQSELNKANTNSALNAFKQAKEYLTKQVEARYNQGVSNILEQASDDEPKAVEFKGSPQSSVILDSIKDRLNIVLNIAVGSALGSFIGVINGAKAFYDGDLYKAIDNAQALTLEKGIVGAVNTQGYETNLITYGDIFEQQLGFEAMMAGEGDERNIIGNYYLVVSQHAGACPLCTPWENKILIDDVYANGKPDGVHTLYSKAIKAGLHHPNCRHKTRVWWGEDIVPENDIDPVANRIQYEAEKKQRYIERNIRQWKRRRDGSLTHEEQLKAKAKVLEWQAKQRQLIKQTNKLPGVKLFRQYSREAIGGETKPTSSLDNLPLKALLPNIKEIKEILPEEHFTKIYEILDKNKEPSFVKTWNKYEKMLQFDFELDPKEQAYYSLRYNKIFINMNSASKENYNTFFHEVGHFIDHQEGKYTTDGHRSSAFRSKKFLHKDETGYALNEMLIEEYNKFEKAVKKNLRKREGKYITNLDLKIEMYRIFEKAPQKDKGNISDIFEGITNGRIALDAGHISADPKYWKRKKVSVEAFAHMFADKACNSVEYKYLQTLFPKSVEIFEEILKTIGESYYNG